MSEHFHSSPETIQEQHEDPRVEQALYEFLIDFFIHGKEKEFVRPDEVWYDIVGFPRDGFEKLKKGDFDITHLQKTKSSDMMQEYSKYEYSFYVFGQKFTLRGRAAQAIEQHLLSTPGKIPE